MGLFPGPAAGPSVSQLANLLPRATATMGRYAAEESDPEKSCKTRGSYLRVHYKNTRETVKAVRGMKLRRAMAFLENVKEKKEIVPFTRHNGDVGRHAQCKQWGHAQGRWPKKSAEFVLGLLKNCEANAEFKGLDVDAMIIRHAMVNRAPKMRRRTYLPTVALARTRAPRAT